MTKATPSERTATVERGDALAYLRRKISNAQQVIDTGNDRDGSAAAMRRAWETAHDDIAAGLHEGEVSRS